MCSGTSFDVLSRVVEQYASHGCAVERVEATPGESVEGLDVTLDLPLPLDGDAAPTGAALTDDGLRVEFPAPAPATAPTVPAATVTDRTVEVVDGELLLTVELTIDPGGDGATDAPAADAQDASVPAPDATTDDTASTPTDGASSLTARLDAARDESVPPYEDTAYLQALYDACDTFTEMSRHIEMDVVSETVRRYMIEAGVHDPTPYDTGDGAEPSGEPVAGDDGAAEEPAPARADGDIADDPTGEPSSPGAADATAADRTGEPSASGANDAESVPDEPLVTDGVGLPDHLCMGDVVTAVVESVTVHEVQRRLGLGQRRTRDLLDQLDLLDLVLHRVATDPEREVSRDDVVSRIRRRAGT